MLNPVSIVEEKDLLSLLLNLLTMVVPLFILKYKS